MLGGAAYGMWRITGTTRMIALATAAVASIHAAACRSRSTAKTTSTPRISAPFANRVVSRSAMQTPAATKSRRRASSREERRTNHIAAVA